MHGSLGNPKKSAQFCHETLDRQLRTTYDPLDWVTNAAVLSQFYSNQGNYRTARWRVELHSTVHATLSTLPLVI